MIFHRHVIPEEYRSVQHWIRNKMEDLIVKSAGDKFGTLQPTSGNAGLRLDGEDKLTMVVTSGFPSCILKGVLLTTGKWYYEFTCHSKGVAVQNGWVDLEFVGCR